MTKWTHPEPRKFALATSAIAAADHFIKSEVTESEAGWLVTFETGHEVLITEGPLQSEYRV